MLQQVAKPKRSTPAASTAAAASQHAIPDNPSYLHRLQGVVIIQDCGDGCDLGSYPGYERDRHKGHRPKQRRRSRRFRPDPDPGLSSMLGCGCLPARKITPSAPTP